MAVNSVQGHSAFEVAQTEQASLSSPAERLADALMISELRYRRLFEAARDGILILDSQMGKITDANPFMTKLLGYSQDELMGKQLWEIGLLPDERTNQEALHQLHQSDFIRYDSLPLATRTGDTREMEVVSNLYHEGVNTVIQCNIRDITERKALERAAEQLLTITQEQADHDSLTGLLNHRAFYKRLEEETLRTAREGTAFAVAVLDLDNFKFFNDAYGHLVGDQVLRMVAECLKTICRPYDAVSRFGGDEFALLLVSTGATPYHEIASNLRTRTSDLHFLPEGHDVAIPITLSVGVALFPDHGLEPLEIVNLADARLLRAKTGGSDGEGDDEPVSTTAHMRGAVEGFSLLDALVTAVDNKDRYTRRHSEDVLDNSLLIARELGLSEEEVHTVAISALIHDVGKIGVPDAILRKPGKLTDEEFQAVKRHPQMGAAIISAVPGLEGTLDAVRYHHERWDGQGYPSGLLGEKTPLLARLMAVADAFSAITMDRPYRKGMAHEDALSILEAGAGTQWDPTCVAAFLRAQQQTPKATTGWGLA